MECADLSSIGRRVIESQIEEAGVLIELLSNIHSFEKFKRELINAENLMKSIIGSIEEFETLFQTNSDENKNQYHETRSKFLNKYLALKDAFDKMTGRRLSNFELNQIDESKQNQLMMSCENLIEEEECNSD